MRVVVMGAGLAGVTAAYELMRDGHEVTVLERLEGPALFTSYANAGLVAPGHAYAWASPRAPRILLKSLFDKSQALRFRPSADPRLWAWTLAFLRNCTAERARINTKRKVRLCRYSQSCLQETTAREGLAYDGQTGGLLYLYRSQESFERGALNSAILAEEGLDLRTLSPDEAAAQDPALAPVRERFAGALFCASDESGDARLFTEALSERCREGGVIFEYGVEVQGFEKDGQAIAAAKTDRGSFPADAFVLALGVMSPRFARTLEARLPIYPIKGYSVTFPIAGRNNAPRLGGVDEDNLMAYCRFGDRLRVTATAEFAGYDTAHKPSDYAPMLRAVKELFPEAADFAQPDYWAGLRPMTPEGTPLLGPTRYRNLYVNCGHGHMGWTMASGTGRITADLIAGRKPAIDLDGLLLAA